MSNTRSTKPPLPKTGFAHKKCYASHLNDCSNDISLEHWVPRCLLKRVFGNTGFSLSVSGSNKNSLMPLTLNTAGSNILCKRHNSALGNIDSVAGKWFDIMESIFSKKRTKFSKTHYSISANELALVLIQMGCGVLRMDKVSIPDLWIEALFLEHNSLKPTINFPHDIKVGQIIPNNMNIEVSILNEGSTHKPIGVRCKVFNLELTTYIGVPESNKSVNSYYIKSRGATIHFI